MNEQLVMKDTNGHTLVEAKQPTPMHLLEIAMTQGLDADKLGKLMELHFQWEKNEARKAFIVAMTAFKANAPEIAKNKHVQYNQVDYWHATLDNVVNTIAANLSKYGITHRWETSTDPKIRVTCILTHEAGHSESTTLEAGPDTSGSKNSIQAVGSTVTYLQRYTLLSATGLATKGQDDDGKTEGMGAQQVEEYLSTINDASSLPELQRVWTDAHKAAKAIKDLNAIKTFQDAKDKRKADLQ